VRIHDEDKNLKDAVGAQDGRMARTGRQLPRCFLVERREIKSCNRLTKSCGPYPQTLLATNGNSNKLEFLSVNIGWKSPR
jgi:hypothetical protein